jgi:hypothetical protein
MHQFQQSRLALAVLPFALPPSGDGSLVPWRFIFWSIE